MVLCDDLHDRKKTEKKNNINCYPYVSLFSVRYHKLQKYFATCSAIFCIHATSKNTQEAKTPILTPHLTPTFHKLM